MQVVLFDDKAGRQQLYPFAAIRPLADMRVGILTFRERYELLFQSAVYSLTEDYLQQYSPEFTASDYLYINARLLPLKETVAAIQKLKAEEALVLKDELIAVRTNRALRFPVEINQLQGCQFSKLESAHLLQYAFDIVRWNKELLQLDFELLTKGKKSATLSATNGIAGKEHIFIEEGAIVEHCILNAKDGPIYIGKNSLVMEGSMIRGPFAMLANSVIKMGSKIYGTTTVGRHCIAGGEIKNTVFFDYSNKAHDGYLGDAVIGSWCNLGAGTSCSNLKNTAGEIKIWNPAVHHWIAAGNKCGVIMGDYSRTAINTAINTGTVTGICCNIVSSELPPKFITDFTWNVKTNERYVLEKVFKDIDNWMKLKNKQISEKETDILSHIYNQQS